MIDLNSPSDEDEGGFMETMPTDMINVSPFGKKASH